MNWLRDTMRFYHLMKAFRWCETDEQRMVIVRARRQLANLDNSNK